MARKRMPQWLTAANTGDWAALDSTFAPAVVVHYNETLLPPLAPGVAGVKQILSTLRTAFPDLKLTIAAEAGQGQTRVYTWAARGTHRGPLLRVHATGRPVAFPGRFMMRYEQGRVVELWIRMGLIAILSQLGMAPTQVS
jgi:predicted ester cyclase